MFNAQAEDLAIEDTILAMDKALQAGVSGLTVDAYLKQVWKVWSVGCKDTILAMDTSVAMGSGVRFDMDWKKVLPRTHTHAHTHACMHAHCLSLQVRALCRRQFFARAMGLKVAEVQAAAPAPQAVRAHHSLPYSVMHGDSWTHGTAQPSPPPPPPPAM